MSVENGLKENDLCSSSVKSEEVQSIIDRMPTSWVKWVALTVSLVIGVAVLLGFVIEYPDTIDGQISITSKEAPIRLIANNSGRIQLLKNNNTLLRDGDNIAYLENGANFNHVFLIDSLVKEISNDKNILLPDSLILGEIGSSYNNFKLSYEHYVRTSQSDKYLIMKRVLKEKILSDEKIIANMLNELVYKKQIVNNSSKQLLKDSILFSLNGISLQEYEKLHASHLALQESLLNLNSSILSKQSDLSKSELEIQRISVEESEYYESSLMDYITKKQELLNMINLWKEKNILFSPISGHLEYIGFWKNNSFIKSGVELFTIIPNKNDILGEVIIPSYGAGKVKIGQEANIKINNYPYDEYGLIKGKVETISRVSNKIEMQNNVTDVYLVTISFPKGLVTNFGKELLVDFETKGTAEIITKKKKLIERLFDNLKSKGEK